MTKTPQPCRPYRLKDIKVVLRHIQYGNTGQTTRTSIKILITSKIDTRKFYRNAQLLWSKTFVRVSIYSKRIIIGSIRRLGALKNNKRAANWKLLIIVSRLKREQNASLVSLLRLRSKCHKISGMEIVRSRRWRLFLKEVTASSCKKPHPNYTIAIRKFNLNK